MSPFHARVAAELAAIEPQDALERQQWQQARDWVASGAELCRLHKPATPAQHLVSYFVLDDGQHLLLVDHHNAGLWLPTGGHVDPGEHPRATVQRELLEELGLALPAPVGPPLMLTIGTTVGLTAGHTDVSLWYRVSARRDQPLHWDRSEFADARWFAFDQLPLARCEPQLQRYVARLRAADARLPA